ncbi:twin-arginine translocase subunit TatC [Streptomyces acidiscabies]|uniref:Sec-independent protein translocase protein TatC n=1 Tax=Streptomyces acidiscabies TaxID=42234 RepID=A0AAP6EED6_9ACTN|nr:twin-arginine translocase subunit TatC [Streptomyces acidiscabies]MBP5940676.1 twin-arginine translocase subunit TatC [Streptomyces sp. LBUM 1476]MBZ3911941.1 twin-arginine translocase subunit TatC [Streptomyces acidiscabies]MDX2959748.1 twin-arginine translocase subunit TatC [Streptomyces acidiscabies]MDX3022260.1 twin-arginine translocase subunit TatC [Streptomyces acidiscabies]MDX3792574.1 twin-arginine translocase subunit TatC [Streptomyces acidiscabies]
MLKSARKKEKDPEGRMPLVEHLRELRNRLGKAVLAIILCAIVGAVYYQDIINVLTEPIRHQVGCTADFTELAKRKDGACGNITMSGLMGPFTLMIKVSLTAGVVLASPIWLYQLWAFIAPGLHKHERKYAYAFVGAGAPLFMAGGWFSYHVLPAAAEVMLGLTPDGTINLLPLDELLDLVTRMVIVFGLSFELPLLLVLLNLTGIVTGKRMLSWWRGMVMGVTVFAAFATPTVDPVSMLSLAAPIVALYFAATGFSLLNDRRKRRREEMGPGDDEASELDLTPSDIGEVESVPSARALPGQSSTERVNGYDDVT